MYHSGLLHHISWLHIHCTTYISFAMMKRYVWTKSEMTWPRAAGVESPKTSGKRSRRFRDERGDRRVTSRVTSWLGRVASAAPKSSLLPPSLLHIYSPHLVLWTPFALASIATTFLCETH